MFLFLLKRYFQITEKRIFLQYSIKCSKFLKINIELIESRYLSKACFCNLLNKLFQMPDTLVIPANYIIMADTEPDLSTFENKTGLAEDMKFLASMPELCDVTFLVGDTREPVCAVKAVLAARSRVFHKMLYQVSIQKKKFLGLT